MSWENVKIGSFLKNRDLRFKPNDPNIKGLKRIDKIDFSGNIILSEKPSNTDMILVKKGDLVISGINVEKGAMSVYLGEEDIIATIHYSSYEFDSKKIDLDFLKSFLKSSKFVKAIKEQVPGGIKTEIKPKHILPLEVLIPTDINEQKRIVTKLQSKFNKIESIDSENKLQLDLLKKLRQQILQDAVQGRLVPQNPNDEPAIKVLERIKSEKEQLIAEGKLPKDRIVKIKNETEPFVLPDNWEWCRLSDIAEALDPNPSHRMPQYVNNGIPFISTENFLPDDKIDFTIGKKVTEQTLIEHINRYEVHDNSFAFSRIGSIGKTIKLPIKRDYCLSHALSVINPFSKEINLKYLRLVMSSKFILKQAKSDVKSISVPDLGMAKIRNFFIPLSPLKEQNRIVEKIEHFMKLIDELEQTIQQNQKYTQDLLQVALKEALETQNI